MITRDEQIFETYNNCPIVLAIIQFRYKKIEEFDSAGILATGAGIKSTYPVSSVNILHTVNVDSSSETKIALGNKEINGVRFDSENRLKTLTIGNEKLTLEVHGKYPGWAELEKEAKKLWQIFSVKLKNVELIGLSLRYTNRINLPINTHDIRDYITTYIHSDTRNSFINQFQLRYTSITDDNTIIHVGHVLEPAIDNSIPYFLDIDVIKLDNIPNEEETIWDIFSKLRSTKNKVFNDEITESTKKLIR